MGWERVRGMGKRERQAKQGNKEEVGREDREQGRGREEFRIEREAGRKSGMGK